MQGSRPPRTDLQVRSQERFPLGELEVVAHEEVEQCRGLVACGGQLGRAALQHLVAEGGTHVHPALEER